MKLENDFDIVIGHMLGVDHVGHRFGPNHFEMKNKLKQYNEFFQNVKKKTIVSID